MSVVEAITGVFTSVLSFFTTALASVANIFYNSETGLTFIGVIALVTLAIGVITMLIGMVRGLIKGRG